MPTKRRASKSRTQSKTKTSLEVKDIAKVPNKHNPNLFRIGLYIVITSLTLLSLIVFPAIKNEVGYFFNKPNPSRQVEIAHSEAGQNSPNKNVIIAKDKDFSIVIPKIGANAKVIANVDPNNSEEYQVALTKGVAHARGTSFPDQPGNTFLFAHSSDTLLNANIFNAVFYLLNKMQKDDVFYIAYKSKLYRYKVVSTEIVEPYETSYYNLLPLKQTTTLMTCWPPATTLKRLVVVGELDSPL